MIVDGQEPAWGDDREGRGYGAGGGGWESDGKSGFVILTFV